MIAITTRYWVGFTPISFFSWSSNSEISARSQKLDE